MLGEQVLHHVRCLRALVDRQALLACIPVGDYGAGFVGNASMSAGDESGFDHLVGVGEGLIHRADIELALETQIVAERRVDHRSCRVECGFRIGDGGKFLISHVNQFAAVLGFGAAARDHGAHCFALPARHVDGDRRLRRRFQPFEMCQYADPRRHHLGEFRAGNNGDDAGRFSCRICRDCRDSRMRVRRAYECDMRHAGQDDVADVGATALRQPRQIGPRHRAADIGVRPVERGENGRRIVDDFHLAAPARACATDSTASTMAG